MRTVMRYERVKDRTRRTRTYGPDLYAPNFAIVPSRASKNRPRRDDPTPWPFPASRCAYCYP